MKETDTGYEINTYNYGVLHFVIGREYSAVGTCGMTKDIEVKGRLRKSRFFNVLEIIDDTGRICSINERTLSYL
jgi:hypothetical protein